MTESESHGFVPVMKHQDKPKNEITTNPNFSTLPADWITTTMNNAVTTFTFYLDHTVPKMLDTGELVVAGKIREIRLEVKVPTGLAYLLARHILESFQQLTKNPNQEFFGPAFYKQMAPNEQLKAEGKAKESD